MASEHDANHRGDSRADRTEADGRPPTPPTAEYAPVSVPVSRPADDRTESIAPAPPRSSERRPLAIPGYEILGELGRGGVGVVYKAKQTKLGRLVALKVLLSGAHAGERELARFRAEATTIAQIQHPNVIQVYDVGEHEGVPYLACEYAGGGDLTKWLGSEPLPLATAVRLVYNLARAVGAAHHKGVIHRDLKPANILLSADNVPKVADFGLAKQFGEQGPTTTGSILGTPQYMSPEQAAGLNRRVGPPTDVYALGVILYECLTGRQPFAGNSVMDTLDRVRFSQPIPLHELRPDIPPELAVIVRRCLEKVPEERYRTADDLANDLARVPRGGSAAAGGDGFLLPAWIAPLIGIVAAAVLGIVVYQRSGWGDSRPTPPAKVEQKQVNPVNPNQLPIP